MPTEDTPGEDDDLQLSFRRRRVLAASGLGIAGLAGCAGSDDDDDDGEDPDSDAQEADDGTEAPTEEPADAPEDDEDEQEDVEPASFEVVDIDYPDEIAVDEEHTLSVTVENTGGEAGDWEALLEYSFEGEDGWDNVGMIGLDDVDPGDTATWESNPTAFEIPVTVQFRLDEYDTVWVYEVTIEEPDDQSFSGSGQSVEQGIDIEGGLVVVEGSHDGESNFQVSLEDDSDFGENFINEIGSFDGAQANLVEEGEYILDVNADGNWDVTIRQPRSGDSDSLSATFSGNGSDVVGPVWFDGTGVASGEHDGDSNFQVQIYPMTGSFGESVFNDIGEFDGETTYSFDGAGWVDVNANGNWTVGFDG